MKDTKIQPELGMGATICGYSDRHAATIIGMTYFSSGTRKGEVKAVTVQRDKATRLEIDPVYGVYGKQDYSYEPDTDAYESTFTLRKNGRWTVSPGYDTSSLWIGTRREYYDYSF